MSTSPRVQSPALPTGTVTFLFTDVEGSTQLLQQLQDDYARVLDHHHRILLDAIAAHNGQVVDTQGDSLFAAFPRALEAVNAAVSAQRALAKHDWGKGVKLRVRMGLHTGEPSIAGDRYVGIDVHRAARIGAAGHGGQVLLSETTHALVKNDLPEGVTLRDLGEHRLKDLRTPRHLYQLVAAGLPADFPPLRSLDARPNNLPIQITSFVGREKEIRELKELVSSRHLVTLAGSGGSGKTRLSLETAGELLDRFSDGVWLVELAPLSDPALVPQAIATTVGVQEQAGRPILDLLIDYLKPRQLLLILDNCEHLIQACADLADRLLHACPNLKILASSREALGIAGETTYRVPSLSLPDPRQYQSHSIQALDALMQYEAVRLFADRATTALPNFSVTANNAAAVAQVCQRLDGMPLAIELAAARVKGLAVDQIAARLDERFRLLTGGSRVALPRQQTLRATIDWSYALLSAQERVLLQRLSVFAGGWTLEAAEQVCAGEGIDEFEVTDLLLRLVDRSLVVVKGQESEARYRLLETIRQYAREKLLDSEQGKRVRDQHLTFFLKLAQETSPKLKGAEQVQALTLFEQEHDNFRAALRWSIESNAVEPGLALAVALSEFWEIHGHLAEARAWLTEILATGDTSFSDSQRAVALHNLGRMALMEADPSAAREYYQAGLELSSALNDKENIAFALNGLGNVAIDQGENEAARAFFMRALTLRRELGDEYGVGNNLSNLGTVEWKLGHLEEARSLVEQSLAVSEGLGDVYGGLVNQLILGYIDLDSGDVERAKEELTQSLSGLPRFGDRRSVPYWLDALGSVAVAQERPTRAAKLLGAAEWWHQVLHAPFLLDMQDLYERTLVGLRSQLGEAAFNTAWAEGRALTLEQAVDLAMQE